MSRFASNLKFLRAEKKLNQQELAEMIGVGRTAIANYETGVANPTHKTLLEIVRVFHVSLDDLLHADLASLPQGKHAHPEDKGPAKFIYQPVMVTVDSQGDENIVMVDTKAAAGYPTRFLEPEFYKELPAFKIPGSDYRNGTFRCFEVEGDSMTDTLQNGDFVIGRFCDNHFKDIREGFIHVVVTTDNVLVKRIINKAESENKLVLLSDNEVYPPIEVDVDDVKEIWYVKSKLSSYMPVKKHDIEKVIGDLTMQVQLLKSRLDTLERN